MFNKPGRFARAFSCASGWLLSVGWQVAGVRRIVRVVAFGVVVLLTVCFSVGVQVIQGKTAQSIEDEATPEATSRKWWQFWR
jgi:hypothetical protein